MTPDAFQRYRRSAPQNRLRPVRLRTTFAINFRMMDEALRDMARHHAYGSLGLDADPELGFAGVRALRELADFCEELPGAPAPGGGS